MKITDKYVFFWGEWLSNFYPCRIEFKSKVFKSSEQFFMFMKAMHFNDIETTEKILLAETPKEAKKLGRQVKNFNDQLWNDVKVWTMKLVITEKFKQNRDLLARLTAEQFLGRTFVEASPYDRIWGIGYSEEDALDNINNWGENLRGKILTNYRNSL